MKNLLLITSHRQIAEISLNAKFLQASKFIKNFDLLLHVNNFNLDLNEVRTRFNEFPNLNKHLILTNKNNGYALGPHEAISDNFEILKEYDNVIHTHTDVFITKDELLYNIVNSHKDAHLLINRGMMHLGMTLPSSDLFIIRPKLLEKNIFKDYNIPDVKGFQCEKFLDYQINKFNISHQILPRWPNEAWNPSRKEDDWGCWHEHNLSQVRDKLISLGLS